MTTKTKKIFWSSAFYLWTAVILVLTSIPTLPSVETSIVSFDKIAHAGVYFIFSFFLFYKLRTFNLAKPRLRKIFLSVCIFFPIFDEIHQLFIPGRQCSFYDLAADFIGILFFILILKMSRKIFTKREI